MQEIYEWFRWLNQATGINLTIVYDSYDRERMIDGFFNTIYLSFVCLGLSVVIGVVG